MKKARIWTMAAGVALLSTCGSQVWAVDPLAGDVVYYYNYSNDGTTNAVTINDQSPNNWDLGNFFPEDFVYSNDPLPFGLPGRIFDAGASNHGGLTEPNPMSHADIVGAGGYAFESWVKRTSDTAGVEHLWNPEGTHSIEIGNFTADPGREIQVALRGLQAMHFSVDSTLPIGEWHHVMAVLEVQPPPPANPSLDPLLATYTFYVDGVQLGTIGPHDLNASFTTLDFSPNPRHGVAHNEFGAGGVGFRGQLAFTRLSLGALSVRDSLFVPEPSSVLLLSLVAVSLPLLRRTLST